VTRSQPVAAGVSVGDVFAVPLAHERIGLCRVIAAEKPRGAWDTQGRWRAVTCEWVGGREGLAAALADPAALAPMRRLSAKGRPHVQSIGGPPPASFVRVGHVAPSASDRRLARPRNPGAWVWVESALATELAHRREPGAADGGRGVRAAAAGGKGGAELAQLRREAKERTARAKAPLGVLDRGALARAGGAGALAHWREAHPAGFVREVKTTLRALARTLTEAPRRASAITAALARATKAIDRIDARWEHRIATPDAEDLVALLVALGVAAGLDGAVAEEAVDGTRGF